MHRIRLLVLVPLVAGATGGLTAAPGAAVPNQCAVGMYPAVGGAESSLKTACTYQGAPLPPTSSTIHDFDLAMWHFGAADQVTGNTTGAGGDTITVAAPAGASGSISAAVDVNHSIEGAGLAPGTFIKSIAGAGPWTVTIAPTPKVAGGVAAATLFVANSRAREVTDGVTNTGSCGAATNVCSATANFMPNDIGKSISGGSLPDGAKITAIASATKVTISAGAGVVAATGVPLQIAAENPVTSARRVVDAQFVAPNTICSATAGFSASDNELAVTGAAPANTRITAVGTGGACPAGTTKVSVNTVLIAGTNKVIDVGRPTKTAPTSGTVVGNFGVDLVLNPALFAGAPPCSQHRITGQQLQIQWFNPGSYSTGAPPSTTGGDPANVFNFSVAGIPKTTTAQLVLTTSGLKFAGFLVQKSTGWDIVFGFLPVAVGVCQNEPVSVTFDFAGATLNQLTLPSRQVPAYPAAGATYYTGPAGSTFVRRLKTPAVSTLTTASVVSGTATTVAGACKITVPRTIDPLVVKTNADGSKDGSFKCGNG